MTETGQLHDLIKRLRNMLAGCWLMGNPLVGGNQRERFHKCCFCGAAFRGGEHFNGCPYNAIMTESNLTLGHKLRAEVSADPDVHRDWILVGSFRSVQGRGLKQND